MIKIENNKIYKTSSLCERTDIFEIVEKIPPHFFVWNIGENMGTHEYIPICEDLHPEDKKDYQVNLSTLKAVKVTPDEWENLGDGVLRDFIEQGIIANEVSKVRK